MSVSADGVLVAGLACVFVAIVLAAAAVAAFTRRPSGVAVSLAAVGAMRMSPPSLREQDLQRPFVDRVLEPAVAWFVTLGRRFTPDDRLQRMRRQLDLAGNPTGWDVDRMLGVKALSGVLGFLLGLVVPSVLGSSLSVILALMVAGAVGGWLVPAICLYQVAYNRSAKVRRALPDALDLMTISVESGLSFDGALAQVATKTRGPLAAELFRVLQEMQIGTGRVGAMRALAQRTDVPELRGFIGAMIQADAFGISVSGVLRVQAKEMRIKRSQRAEEQAMKVPVKILFPLIFCILPSLFIVVLGPAVINIMQSFSHGGL
jgi:tight adherence protein C